MRSFRFPMHVVYLYSIFSTIMCCTLFFKISVLCPTATYNFKQSAEIRPCKKHVEFRTIKDY